MSKYDTSDLNAFLADDGKSPSAAPAPKKYDTSDLDAFVRASEPVDLKADPQTKTDTASAAVMGLADGASMGLADKMAGGLEALGSLGGVRGLGGKFSDIRRANDDEDKQSFMDIYRQGRDAKRAAYDQAESDSPKAFKTGQFGGKAAAAMIPAMALGKGASLGATIGSNAAQGALEGVARNKSDMTKGEFDRVALDAYLGSMLGGATGMAGKGVENLLGKAAGNFSDVADARTIKALEPTLAQQELINNKGVAKELAKELRDEGVVRFGSSVKDMSPRLAALLDKKGSEIGAIREGVDDTLSAAGKPNTAVDMARLSKIGDSKAAFSDATNEGTQAAAEAYARNADSLAKVPSRSIREAQGEVQSLSDQIPFNKSYADRTASQQGMTDLRRDIVKQIDDRIAEVSPDKAAQYQKLKDQFALFKGAEPILDKSVARQARNRDFSLTDYLSGNMSDGGASSVKGAAMMGLNKMARERGNSALSIGADKAASLLEAGQAGRFTSVLQGAMNRGGAALDATHSLLMRDPEYRKLIGEG